MAKSKSYGGTLFFVVVIAAAAAGGWYYFRGTKAVKPEFQLAKVTRGDIEQAVTATGDLQPVVIVDIGAQVSGQISEVLVDFNSKVKQGDVLARIDESTPTQRLNQAKADLASATANNQLIKINAQRTKDLFDKKLVSQQELDSINAQLAQSDATLLTREAAVANAELDLERTVIRSPIDGMVLDRKTDKGRTVNASMNAPVLFTLVNDLSKMQINAAVAEADVGSISEGQDVKFTVDAFPNRTFTGKVRQVRNAASTNQNVVSYATIIDVANPDLKLKPGMTANVSIIVQQRPNVLRVENGVLRVRIPQELAAGVVDKTGADAAKKDGGKQAAGTVATMTDAERMRATFDIMREVGVERGSPASPDQIEKAKVLAKEKGLDPDLVAARLAGTGMRIKGGGREGGGTRRTGGPMGGAAERGFNNTVVSRDLYRVPDPDAVEKTIEKVTAKLGISDGFFTEVLDGLEEGDTLLKGVLMPGATPSTPSSSTMRNPFSGSRGPMRRGG